MIDKRQRNRCQYCRYMKCINNGMKREGECSDELQCCIMYMVCYVFFTVFLSSPVFSLASAMTDNFLCHVHMVL